MIDLDILPNSQRRALEIVREVALEKDSRPFLVGGPVRDLLLGRHAIDVDLSVEEDASPLARALAKRVNGRVRSFPQFLTYKVSAADLPEIDIATARKERYRSPGALPGVTAGKLKDDLLRRDFAMNAIAVDLIDHSVHDPVGGAADVERRVVRVLHDRSFVDDPTRIYRAIRLAGRLAFGIEEHTAALMRRAIAGKALETVSRERIWREIFLAMDEKDAPAILDTMQQWSALSILFGSRERDPDLRPRLTMAAAQISANPDLDRYVLYTGALLMGDASPVDLEGSGFSQKRARNLVQLANEVPRFSDALAAANSDGQRFRLYKSASREMLSVLSAVLPGESGRIARFHDFRKFVLPLRGNDLEVPGGPHVAKALERTREAVFTGEIEPDQARSFARELAKQYLDEQL